VVESFSMLAISLMPFYQSVRGKLRAVPSYLISPASRGCPEQHPRRICLQEVGANTALTHSPQIAGKINLQSFIYRTRIWFLLLQRQAAFAIALFKHPKLFVRCQVNKPVNTNRQIPRPSSCDSKTLHRKSSRNHVSTKISFKEGFL
jgi:hypothetical protein